MPVHNADIAAIFDEIADLLEIEGADPFRIRAYRNGARCLGNLGKEAAELVKQGADLTELPGIGERLAEKIIEIVNTGHCKALDKIRREMPAGIADLLAVPGLGPKRVATLYHELDVHTLEQLHRAARDHAVQALPGFGAKTEEKIETFLSQHKADTQRLKLATAAPYAESLAEYMRRSKAVAQVTIAGSYRRCKETVGDLDFVVSSRSGAQVMEWLDAYDEVKEIVAQGPTRATVMLRSGLQVDVRVVKPESYGAALHYFTGSKAHNIVLRRIAQKKGLKINEYGVFRADKKIAGTTEESVFKSVGLPWIPPELRENQGEIEAAERGVLPKLVELSDLAGDLHAHTNATDGHNTLAQMVAAAQKSGLKYLAITEHSKHLRLARGLDTRRLLKQMDAIDALNEKLKGFVVLKGIEVDILEHGELDLPDDVLGRLDLVVGAVHSQFHLSRAQQTQRILKAMDHPHFSILAHPSGRLLQSRDPYDVDMARIIRHAYQRGCFLEINAHPERLDLTDAYCHMAKDEGVLLAISSDAHSTLDFANLKYGVGQARRGWLSRQDVLNTRSLPQLRKLLRGTM